ncbi:lateral signaling target protein 2 homolog isoform X1 [Hemiscyllium ocellatum]|uniref:lateral signaling target protein 2 homolog isoform X1 n=2 Tax=Hemiscyllium ocellatum TaxID=170820 RepID=UPI002966A74E|nr:lateral signaling target protein 2 homolog isoform X1 [Hemiscyllium ocellatum]
MLESLKQIGENRDLGCRSSCLKCQRSNPHPVAQFFYADKEVTQVMMELNNVNLHNDPQQYMVQLNNLRARQDHMLQIINQIMDDCIPNERSNRDFRVKFPDEVLQEQLGVQLWFAAECLVAGSLIDVHESEMLVLHPLAEDLLHSLEEVRYLLREQSLSDYTIYTDDIKAALVRFDRLFAEFELSYVAAVVPIKSPEELYNQQQIIVLFCETIDRALKLGYLTQDMIDGLEPELMFTIPRLAIICGLRIYPEGPLNLQQQPNDMSLLFKPFYTLLQKIRDLLYVLTDEELSFLEKSLCAVEAEDFFSASTMLPSLSSLHNSMNNEGLEESTYTNGVSPVPQDSEKLDQLKSIVHQAPSEVYSPQSNPNLAQFIPNDVTEASKEPNLQLETENELWGEGFGQGTIGSRLENAPKQEAAALDYQPESSLSASASAVCLTHSNIIQHFTVTGNSLASENDHSQLAGLEATGISTFHVTPVHYFTDSPDTSSVPTTSEQDYVGHSVNTVKQKAVLSTYPSREHMEGIEKHNEMVNTSHDMSKQYSYNGRAPSTPVVPEEPHFSNLNTLEREDGSRVVDHEAVKQAVCTARATAREELRSRYRSRSDMLHRLFVCISGVADQLQTNFAGDLRRILKTVFDIATSTPEKNMDALEEETEEDHVCMESTLEDCSLCQESHSYASRASNFNNTKLEVPPEWIADSACNQCTSCKAPFTIVRRRHHCRNCGKIFCSRCSSQSAPLPWYGHMKPVRVCAHCYTFHLSPCYSGTSTC